MSTDRQTITLAQVAAEAQVSIATASRVLHGAGGSRHVRPELRNRVLESARALSYVPNAHAQALAAGSTRTVGLITHDIGDPYFGCIARGAMRVANERGAMVLLASTSRDPDRELEHVAVLRAQRAQAILLTGSGFESEAHNQAMIAQLLAFEANGGRVAMVSHHALPFDAVLPDNRRGAAEAARHLLALGHRDIGVLSGQRTLTTVIHRLEGFSETLAGKKLALTPSRVIETEFSEEGGYAGALELIKRGLDVTALFCISDMMAIGALQALREHGVAVPDDISVVGFDDIPIVRQLSPALTTVVLPLEEMGERVVTMALDDRVSTGRRRVHVAPARMVVRESTAPNLRRRNARI